MSFDPAVMVAAGGLLDEGRPDLGQLDGPPDVPEAEKMAYVRVSLAILNRARRTRDWAEWRRDNAKHDVLYKALLIHLRADTAASKAAALDIRHQLIDLFIRTTVDAPIEAGP